MYSKREATHNLTTLPGSILLGHVFSTNCFQMHILPRYGKDVYTILFPPFLPCHEHLSMFATRSCSAHLQCDLVSRQVDVEGFGAAVESGTSEPGL